MKPLVQMGQSRVFQTQCLIMEMDIDCPPVEDGANAQNFDICRGGEHKAQEVAKLEAEGIEFNEEPGDEECAGSYSLQWACEMKNMAAGGSGDQASAYALQNQAMIMTMGSQLDEIQMAQQEQKEQLQGVQDEMNDRFNGMHKLMENQTGEVMAKIEESRLQQNAQLAKMMQATNCNAELQMEKLNADLTSNGQDGGKHPSWSL
jgi:hypothetical protein